MQVVNRILPVLLMQLFALIAVEANLVHGDPVEIFFWGQFVRHMQVQILTKEQKNHRNLKPLIRIYRYLRLAIMNFVHDVLHREIYQAILWFRVHP